MSVKPNYEAAMFLLPLNSRDARIVMDSASLGSDKYWQFNCFP